VTHSEEAIRAGLHGPEAKEVRLREPTGNKSHEFNIKPLSYRVHRAEVTAFGQLSHRLAFRTDDQVWFAFKKEGARVQPASAQKMVVEKEHGGVLSTIARLRPIGVAVGAYFGVDAGQYFDALEKHEGDFGFIDFDDGWERAAGDFIEALAKQLSPPRVSVDAGLRLFADDNLRGRQAQFGVNRDIANAKEVGWNDRASSLLASVPDDKRLELYQHDHFRGRMLELGPGTHIVRDLKIHKLGDAITSVRWR
jgi:hypothetical protein